MNICKVLLIAFLVNLPQLALAATVKDLYSATVSVSDQSTIQRQKGFSLALAEVLIKTTGAKNIVAHRGVGQALAKANNYMVKYAYLQQYDPASLIENQVLNGEQAATEQMPQAVRLSVQFAKASIDELIRTLGLPIWPSNRPEILVWVVEQTASGYRFVDEDDLPRSLEASFARRGLPFQLPLYDLGDRLALDALAAWSLNQGQLQDAATRYSVDHWLVLRYSQLSSGGVRGSWYLGGLKKDFTANGALLNTLQAGSSDEFVSASVDQVADHFAQQMSYYADTATNLFRLVVENVGNFTAFTQLTSFLEGLEIVNVIKVRSIEGDILVLDLTMEGESRVLLRALNKEPRLSRVRQVSSDDFELSVMPSQPSNSQLSSSPPRISTEHFRWQAVR